MGVTNGARDSSGQEREYYAGYGAFSTGASNATVDVPIAVIPYASTLIGARAAATGISNVPTLNLYVQRFIVGSGTTAYQGGFTIISLQAVGTSGIQSVTIAAAGSTALGLLAGDVITGTFAGQDSAVTSLAVSVVIKATQDIRQFFGL